MPIKDVFSHLEIATDKLISRLGSDHSDYRAALLYQAQLNENIQLSRMHGDTEQRRSDRSIILQKFIGLSLDNFGITFSDLCSSSDASVESNDSALYDAEKIIHSKSYRRDIKRLFELGKIDYLATEYTNKLIFSVANTASNYIAQNIIGLKIKDWKAGKIKNLDNVIKSIEFEIKNYSISEVACQQFKLLIDEWYEAFAMDLSRLLSPIFIKYHLTPIIPELSVDNTLEKILSSLEESSTEKMSAEELDFMNSLWINSPWISELASFLGIGTGTISSVACLFVLGLSIPALPGALIATTVGIAGYATPSIGLRKLQKLAEKNLLKRDLSLDSRTKITQENVAAQLPVIQKILQKRITKKLNKNINFTAMLDSAKNTLGEPA